MFEALMDVKERSMAENQCPTSFLSVVKVFEKLLDNMLVDHLVDLQKCGLFSDFQYGFSSFQSTVYNLKVVYSC